MDLPASPRGGVSIARRNELKSPLMTLGTASGSRARSTAAPSLGDAPRPQRP